MADDASKAGKGDGQSIPAMLAASPKASAPRSKPKPVVKETTKTVAAPVVNVAATPAPTPVVANPVAPPVKIESAFAPIPVPVVPQPTSEPTALTAVVEATPAPLTPADASAPVAQTPPAAVPADIQKESQMATTIENAAQTTTDKASAIFTETSERAKGAMAKSAKMVEELNAFGKGNVEALVESSKIAAKGFETLGQDAAEFTRKSFEDATAAFKTLATVKSPTEFLKLQSDFMRSAFDAMVAETSRSTESVLKLAGDVAQPISNRLSVAADKMKIAA